MTQIERALAVANEGYHVFPVVPKGKVPLIKDFPNKASRDTTVISLWWEKWPHAEIGVSTSQYGDGEALIVVDIDVKNGVNGHESYRQWITEHNLLDECIEPAMRQTTRSGGEHLIYRAPYAVPQGVGVLGPGVDIRSRGGFIVLYAKTIVLPPYSPDFLFAYLVNNRERDSIKADSEFTDPSDTPNDRIIHLARAFPSAVSGTRNFECYRLACLLRDHGANNNAAVAAISEHWDCVPMLDEEELTRTVDSAFKSAKNSAGIMTPEVQFKDEPDTIKGPPDEIDELNKEYAAVTRGGHAFVMRERIVDGITEIEYLTPAAFREVLANQYVTEGKRLVPLSTAWRQSTKRRTYDALYFRPGEQLPKGQYNLWQGFSVKRNKTANPEAIAALTNFLDHIHANICSGDQFLNDWFITYFARMFQRLDEKALTAIVMRGLKGTGKSIAFDIIGRLLGAHYTKTANRRYVEGTFNAYLETCVFLVLEEVSWGGDKKVEGQLKELITGTNHFVEYKGCEPFKVKSYTRVALVGNEDWLVNATADERRYAIFNVGNGRQKDTTFFGSIRKGMEAGGYGLLLDYLLTYDISKIDVNVAPETAGLAAQKRETLDSVSEWWLESVEAGHLIGDAFGEAEWPSKMKAGDMLKMIHAYMSGRNIGSRIPAATKVGVLLSRFGVSYSTVRIGKEISKGYSLPSLIEAREIAEKAGFVTDVTDTD